MKFVLLIAVFCVVPCAFQDVWDDYDTWYDELNSLEVDDLVLNLDQPKDDQANEPEPIEHDDSKDHHETDYDDNYRDYEIEDNRDEEENKLEKEQESNQDSEQNDEEVESAVQDFDAFQQIINNDKLSEDVIDKILAVDEKSQMDLNDLLPDKLSDSDNENQDVNPNKPLEKDEVEDKAEKDNEDDVEKGVQDVSIEIGGSDFQRLLEELSDSGSLDNDNAKEGLPEADVKPNSQDTEDETRQILEDTNIDFEENENSKEDDLNIELPQANIEDDMKNIVDETQQILENTDVQFDENKSVEEDEPVAEIEADVKNIIEETRQILEDTNSQFDENKNEKENDQQNVEHVVQDSIEVEEGKNGDDDISSSNEVDKIYEDLNEDLDKLFETWKKLSEDDDVDDNSNNAEDVKVEVNADDDVNHNYDNIGDDAKNKDFDYEGEARILAARNDYYDSIADKDISVLFKEFENEDDGDEEEISSELVENDADENINDSVPILYGNDALAAESSENNEQNLNKTKLTEDDVKENENIDYEKPNEEETLVNKPSPTPNLVEKASVDKSESIKATKDVDELNSRELEELSQQFVMLHDSEIKAARDETPIHITLTADETATINSPNYPNAYPTDQTVVDWIFEGLGTGIEVNVTDLAINSAQGHFLMIKPGQTDASGDSGIVFAYRLNSERRYRFRDVNRMFVRFNPLGGMSFSRGFQLSARMIEPPGRDINEEEDIPEPEFLIPEPRHTATLLLAGVNLEQFLELSQEFQRLLADMATMYINANEIDPGLNATIAVTQITHSYICNYNWPGFESCVQITFGVPLIYEDEEVPSRLTEDELLDMWNTYSGRDPFAARLSQMGISDFEVPREARILTVWVVIGVGVVIAAVMLAFALWRYSCFDNYTRMQEFSDTDSIHDKKRGLDMYPTPHQTLPPLFTENDYKWADRTFDDSTRVDIGGFNNNTFTRDEPSSESEEDVIVSRDSNSYKPRDFNVV